MKAIMSDTLREILRDPKKHIEFEKGISKLSSERESTSSGTVISVGNHEYKVQFVEAEPEPQAKR